MRDYVLLFFGCVIGAGVATVIDFFKMREQRKLYDEMNNNWANYMKKKLEQQEPR